MTLKSPLWRWRVTIPALALLAAVLVQPAAAQEEKTRAIAFRGATIETISGERIEKGNLVVRDGKIEAVGADVVIPDDAHVIEAEGKFIMPGIIDPASTGAGGGGARGGARGQRRGRGPDIEDPPITIPLQFQRGQRAPAAGGGGGGFTRVADSFYPYTPFFRSLPRYGITNISLLPGGLGQAAALRIDPDNPEEMMLNGDGNLSLTVTNSAASLRVIRDGLAGTAEESGGGERAQRQRQTSQRRGRGGGDTALQQRGQRQRGQAGQRGGGASSLAAPLWAKVAKGEAYLVVNAGSSAAILHLSKVLEEHPKVKVALITNGAAVFQTIDVLKKFKPLLILQPRIETKPNTQYRINAASIAHEAELTVAFSTTRGSLEPTRDAPLFAISYLVKTGLPREVALAALTLEPARVIGLADRLGSIEPKKDANLLIFSGDPLSPGSTLERVMLEGKFIHEN